MRYLYINDVLMDIDDSTAIGIDYQAYDVKNPAKRKTSVSNSFTIPKTNKNLQVFGYAGEAYSAKQTVYDYLRCKYYIDCQEIISNGKASLQSISDRIELIVVDKNDIWDSLKLYDWDTFITDIIAWLQSEKGLPSSSSYYNDVSLTNFLTQYTGLTVPIVLTHYWGNLAFKEVDIALNTKGILENADYSVIRYCKTGFNPSDAYFGGHFGLFCKTIFEFLEYKYSVNFYTNSTVLYNLWDDAFAQQMFIPFRELDVRYHKTLGVADGYYFERCNFTSGRFAPSDSVRDKNKKTVYDFVNAFFQHLNVVIKESGTNIRLSRFDDLKDNAAVYDFSARIEKNYTFKPSIEGYGQNTWIKFKDKFEGGGDYENARQLTSSNKTIQATSELFTIDAYVAGIIKHQIGGDIFNVLDLSPDKSFETFTFLIPDVEASIQWQFSDNSLVDNATINTKVAALYSLTGEYLLVDEMLKHPKVYQIKKWLTINDIRRIDFFGLYYIKQLGGSFVINKIEGFNPDKSLQATTIELIYASDRIPVTPPDLNYYVDGVGDALVDGEGDYLI